MIARDQPTCFPPTVLVRVSSKQDGSMLNRSLGHNHRSALECRETFCAQLGIQYENAVSQWIIYEDGRTYDLIVDVDSGSTTRMIRGVEADAMYTRTPGVALFLPVADCAATVVYDPHRRALAIAHLGRHSTYAKLATQVVKHFVNDGSNAADLIVWMSPHAQKEQYKLAWFDKADDPDWQGFYEERADGIYLDMAGFNRQLLEQQGVRADNIHVSPIDTMTDDNYFSHLAGDTTSRIAVVAMIR